MKTKSNFHDSELDIFRSAKKDLMDGMSSQKVKEKYKPLLQFPESRKFLVSLLDNIEKDRKCFQKLWQSNEQEALVWLKNTEKRRKRKYI